MTSEQVEMGMVCTDTEGNKVVIDAWKDHKRVIVGDMIGDKVFFEGDAVRIDELTPTGETWSAPLATAI